MNQGKFRPVVILLVAAAIITGLLLLTPAGLMDGYDLARMHQCYKADLRTTLLAGEIPWWNPFTALGRPFLADVETATLYPPSWLVLPFGVATGILLMIGLHLALAIEGVRRLAEYLGISSNLAWVAGISFALSGALLGRLQSGQLQVFCVICLWSWTWLAAVKLQDEPSLRSIVRTAFWLALSFLAGSPQILWCGLVALGVLLMVRSASLRAAGSLLLRLVATGMLAAGLAALQLLPFIELVQQGNRPLHNTAFATLGGEAGLDWLTLLMPPRPWMHLDGEFNLHGGALFFLLACFAFTAVNRNRNVRALVVAGLIGFVLALGDGSFVLPRLADWIPGFAGVRYPSRYALTSILIVTLLAAWWLDHAFREKRIKRSAVWICCGLQGAIQVAGLFAQGFLYVVPKVPANELHLMADLREEGLPHDGAPPRVAFPASILRANSGAQCGVSTLTGFNSPALARTWTALYIMAGKSPPDFHRAEVSDDIILTLGKEKRYFGLSVVFTQPGNEVHFAPPPEPRAYLSFASSRVPDWKQAVIRVHAGHDFVREALVEHDLFLAHDERPHVGHVDIVRFGRNRIVAEYHSPAEALLVLAEAWYPGWTATINESALGSVIPVNGWMRGVVVPAGTNRVVFEYRPTWGRLGALISAFSCMVALGFWYFPGQSSRSTTTLRRSAPDQITH